MDRCHIGYLSGIGPVVIDLYLPGLPQMASDLHTNASVVQLSLTSCLLGLAIGQIVIGPFSDVLGRRLPLIVSLSVFAAASFLCAMTSSVWVLIAMRFIQGAAGAGGIVISRAIARDLYSGTELTKFFSLLMLVNGIAPIISPVAGGQLMKWTTWNGVFFIIGLFWLADDFVRDIRGERVAVSGKPHGRRVQRDVCIIWKALRPAHIYGIRFGARADRSGDVRLYICLSVCFAGHLQIVGASFSFVSH